VVLREIDFLLKKFAEGFKPPLLRLVT